MATEFYKCVWQEHICILWCHLRGAKPNWILSTPPQSSRPGPCFFNPPHFWMPCFSQFGFSTYLSTRWNCIFCNDSTASSEVCNLGKNWRLTEQPGTCCNTQCCCKYLKSISSDTLFQFYSAGTQTVSNTYQLHLTEHPNPQCWVTHGAQIQAFWTYWHYLHENYQIYRNDGAASLKTFVPCCVSASTKMFVSTWSSDLDKWAFVPRFNVESQFLCLQLAKICQ